MNQKTAVSAHYEEEKRSEALKLKQKIFPHKYPELNHVIRMFNDVMSHRWRR